MEQLSTAYAGRDAVFLAEQERMADVPLTYRDYKIEPTFSDGFAMPEGRKIDDLVSQTFLQNAMFLAHQTGVPQKGVSQLLGFLAESEVRNAEAQQAQAQTWRAAETAKLGETGSARRAAIEAFVGGMAPDELVRFAWS